MIEQIFYYTGATLLILLMMVLIIFCIYYIVNKTFGKNCFLRIVYLSLFVIYADKQGIDKKFKDKNGKWYIITVKEVE